MFEVLPPVAARMVALELVVEVLRVVVVDQHERLSQRQRGVRSEDGGVLVGLAQLPHVELRGDLRGGCWCDHRLLLGEACFYKLRLCKLYCMTYVIGQPCVDVTDRACVDECPVDCIYEGSRSLYIHPDECIDCGACEPVCPVEAIYYEDDLPDNLQPYLADNDAFFTQVLPGRDAPLASPGGAAKLGALGVDTPLVAGLPPQAEPLAAAEGGSAR